MCFNVHSLLVCRFWHTYEINIAFGSDLVNNCNITAWAGLQSLSDQTYFPLYLGLKPARNPVKFTLARTRRALSSSAPLKLRLSSQQIRAVSSGFILKWFLYQKQDGNFKLFQWRNVCMIWTVWWSDEKAPDIDDWWLQCWSLYFLTVIRDGRPRPRLQATTLTPVPSLTNFCKVASLTFSLSLSLSLSLFLRVGDFAKYLFRHHWLYAQQLFK